MQRNGEVGVRFVDAGVPFSVVVGILEQTASQMDALCEREEVRSGSDAGRFRRLHRISSGSRLGIAHLDFAGSLVKVPKLDGLGMNNQGWGPQQSR